MEHGSCAGATKHIVDEQRTFSDLSLESVSVKLNIEILFFAVHCETAVKQHDFEPNEYEFDLEYDYEQLQIDSPLRSHEHVDWQDLLACLCVRLSE